MFRCSMREGERTVTCTDWWHFTGHMHGWRLVWYPLHSKGGKADVITVPILQLKKRRLWDLKVFFQEVAGVGPNLSPHLELFPFTMMFPFNQHCKGMSGSMEANFPHNWSTYLSAMQCYFYFNHFWRKTFYNASHTSTPYYAEDTDYCAFNLSIFIAFYLFSPCEADNVQYFLGYWR